MTESQNVQKKAKFSLYGFSGRLKEAREKAGFVNQRSVAEKLNTTISTVSKWENGTARPPLEALVELAALYNTTTDYLLTGIQTEHVDASRVYGLSNESLDVLKNLNHRLLPQEEATKRFNRNDSPQYYYVHPLGFINELITSPIFGKITFDFTNHVFKKVYMPTVVDALETATKRVLTEYGHYIDESEFSSNSSKKLEQLKKTVEAKGYSLVHPETMLKADEYMLNKLWNKLFRSLLDKDSIWRNGIAKTNCELKKELLFDDEVDRLNWPYINMEVQHEESK